MRSLAEAIELKRSGKLAAAELLLRQLLEREPEAAEIRHHLGNTLVAAGRLAEGLQELRQAYRENPEHPFLAYNLGLALYLNLDYCGALKAFSKAVRRKPDLVDGWINLGLTRHALNRLEEALAAFDKALTLTPKEPEAHWNRALTLLTMGNYREGFAAYEWRWHRKLKSRTYPHDYSQPRWQGEPFPRQRLLIYSEQGFGDCIQFSRFLPEVKKFGGEILFEVRPELIRLLNGIQGCDHLLPFSFSTPCQEEFDLQIPLLSLPAALGVEISQLPPPTRFPALTSVPPAERKIVDNLRIGICRAGALTHVNDHNRSLPRKYLYHLISGWEGKISFFDLQKKAAPDNKEQNTGKLVGFKDPTANWRDFFDAALCIRQLDLVISVDTAIAHLAASLGRPVWLLLPYVPDWRWQRETNKSPWYPGITLFRQPEPGNWESVITRVRQELEEKAAATLILKALRLRETGELDFAADLVRQATTIAPRHIEAFCKLGIIEKERHRVPAAQNALEQAIHLDPLCLEAHITLANLKQDIGRLDEALHHYQAAKIRQPDSPEIIAGQAQLLLKKNRRDDAIKLLAPWQSNKQHHTPALAVVMARLADTPDSLQTTRQSLERLLANTTSRAERRQLLFALGEVCDRLGDYEQAFFHFEAANRAKSVRFDAHSHHRLIDSLIRIYSPEFCRQSSPGPGAGDRAVFVVGMPRSGTTLTEQILASHPQIYGAGELGTLRAIARNLSKTTAPGKSFPDSALHLHPDEAANCATQYLSELTLHAPPEALRIVDKMPQNFLFLGLIRQLFDGARIIHCRRHPLDTILSIFFQNFSALHSYAFSLDNITFWYRQYRRLMEHWKTTLEIDFIEINYENLVTDTEIESRRLLKFLSLEWAPSCLRFYEQKRVVLSASYQQVHRPLYHSSIGRWQNYQQFLTSVIDELGDLL